MQIGVVIFTTVTWWKQGRLTYTSEGSLSTSPGAISTSAGAFVCLTRSNGCGGAIARVCAVRIHHRATRRSSAAERTYHIVDRILERIDHSTGLLCVYRRKQETTDAEVLDLWKKVMDDTKVVVVGDVIMVYNQHDCVKEEWDMGYGLNLLSW